MSDSNFLFKKPLLMVATKWFECVISLFLNLIGIKVPNLNLPKVQQTTIWEFLWKPIKTEQVIFFCGQKDR